jgi:hypothetical protein
MRSTGVLIEVQPVLSSSGRSFSLFSLWGYHFVSAGDAELPCSS